MSLDAGGLAQMTYPPLPPGGMLGMPGSGFASRGRSSHIQHLSVRDQRSADAESQAAPATSTPKTGRSRFLANLRTAPRAGVPPSAPPTQMQHGLGSEQRPNGLGNPAQNGVSSGPRTAWDPSFNGQQAMNMLNPNAAVAGHGGHHAYARPEQVLAPPEVSRNNLQGSDDWFEQFCKMKEELTRQQEILQQQLINATNAANQAERQLHKQAGRQQSMQGQQGRNGFQNAINNQPTQPMYGMPSAGPFGGFHAQAQTFQPAMMPTAYYQTPGQGGQPAYYMVDPAVMTQEQYYLAQAQAAQYAQSPSVSPESHSAQREPTPPRASRLASPPLRQAPVAIQRNPSPPKDNSPPPTMSPTLPPPSANAFRRGHKKSLSVAPGSVPGASVLQNGEGSKTGGFRPNGIPPTPSTGTFQPGQSREGNHPSREPRGPPPLEELIASPTSKHEGSKNFVTRQRRRFVQDLVRAGKERRGVRGSGSAGSGTPASEFDKQLQFDDNDSNASLGSGSLSGEPTVGHAHVAANGAIGSERRGIIRARSRDNDSVSGHLQSLQLNGNGSMSDLHRRPSPAYGADGQTNGEARKSPMLVLTSAAEKRKSSMF
ncbi:MAG: hypothetical protein M4579_002262 [Chaenotheca gracillima]|nr:MAG: hypothetical protein M4579_002262 [Chaenotheca gracillima]